MELSDEKKLISDYRKSNQRLILLDYDGTLITLKKKAEKAEPGDEISTLLDKLESDPKNEVVLISGRDRENMEDWFDVESLVAEHGVWIKEKGKEWRMYKPLTEDWKNKILPILERYVEDTPGSLIEEKDFSLAWHYRNSDPLLVKARIVEILNELELVVEPLNLKVFREAKGKVIEIRDGGINKGKAALKWVKKKNWDFILAIGDDRTDEDIFRVLPEGAYSIEVGYTPTRARFNIDSPESVISLLKKLVEN